MLLYKRMVKAVGFEPTNSTQGWIQTLVLGCTNLPTPFGWVYIKKKKRTALSNCTLPITA
jgi:hypothetical protein